MEDKENKEMCKVGDILLNKMKGLPYWPVKVTKVEGNRYSSIKIYLDLNSLRSVGQVLFTTVLARLVCLKLAVWICFHILMRTLGSSSSRTCKGNALSKHWRRLMANSSKSSFENKMKVYYSSMYYAFGFERTK